MPLNPQLIEKLRSGSYKNKELDLSQFDLTDAEFGEIIPFLVLNPSIKSLNLRNNKLTKTSWVELAKNTTLTHIALTGNTAIKVGDLKPFEANKTLIQIIGARGKDLQTQLKKNSDKPKVNAIKNVPVNDEVIAEDQKNLDTMTSGEISFQQLIHCFLFDLSDFDSPTDFIIWYAAVALNCYMHNASHAPLAEFSSVQDREKNAKLYYSRSQDKHPLARRNDAFIKDDVAEQQQVARGKLRNRGVGVLNTPMIKLFNSSIGDANPVKNSKRSKLLTNLNNIDVEHGFPKKDKKIKDYFSLALAHGGLRNNNITATQTILHKALKDAENPANKLSQLLINHSAGKKLTNTTRKIQKLSPDSLDSRIKAYHAKFTQLSSEKKDDLPNLQAKSLAFKKSRSDYLCREFNAWPVNKEKQMALDFYGDGCLSIDIDPKLLNIPDNLSETKRQEITEALIGFLAGIINHQLAINDLSLWVERRQSFGFNLSTLTDIGSLKIRLSHGLEPKVFNDILLESFKLFYSAIKQKKPFKPRLVKMRSEDKQWRAAFEAQYYLQSEKSVKDDNYVNRAFTQYIDNFGVQDAFKISDPLQSKDEFTKYPKVKPETDKLFEQSPLFAILQNSLSYATRLACSLDIGEINSSLSNKQSYLHCQGKLYLYCSSANELLAKIHSGKIEISNAFQQANKLLENIVEYCLLLDNLHAIQSTKRKTYTDPTIELCKTESQYVAHSFKLQKENIDIYFTDSGQQAIVTTLLAFDLELLLSKKQNNRVDANFYHFGNSYFEVTSFIDDIGWKLTTKSNATLTFIDITKLNQFSLKHFKQLKYLVVDVTHQPLFTNELKSMVAEVQKEGVIVALVSSCLKHDQLGLDKYTSGKITIIKPPTLKLHEDVNKLFKAVSDDGNTHAVRSYLQMANTICGDKNNLKQDKKSLTSNGGLFSKKMSLKKGDMKDTETQNAFLL